MNTNRTKKHMENNKLQDPKPKQKAWITINKLHWQPQDKKEKLTQRRQARTNKNWKTNNKIPLKLQDEKTIACPNKQKLNKQNKTDK